MTGKKKVSAIVGTPPPAEILVPRWRVNEYQENPFLTWGESYAYDTAYPVMPSPRDISNMMWHRWKEDILRDATMWREENFPETFDPPRRARARPRARREERRQFLGPLTFRRIP